MMGLSMASGRYSSYKELADTEKEGIDYRIRWIRRSSGVLVIAPHGGDIEPGTSEIAEALADAKHSFYAFEGIRRHANRDLHIPSTRFDEPIAMGLVQGGETVVTVHGCRGEDPIVFVGGLDLDLMRSVTESMKKAGFAVGTSARLPGRDAMNICNRSSRGRGIQLEISRGLRRLMFKGLRVEERAFRLESFERFVQSVGRALGESDRS